jgi:hypothetical protein
LPGFQFRREDFFNKPSPKEMIADKVYKGFVLPGYALQKSKSKKKNGQGFKPKNVHWKLKLKLLT